MSSDLQDRKDDHLDLCATDRVAFRGVSTLLEDVKLLHQSLPEMRLEDVDTSVALLGKRLRLPLVIAGMTGGTDRASDVNRALAAIAEKRGIGFGVGSQRAMGQQPETAASYQVRAVAPTTLVLGNVGVVQARAWGSDVVRGLVDAIGADALCVHMNPAMELIQANGDRDFRGGQETLELLVRELAVPVVAKETGNGISPRTAEQLVAAGVRTVDVSGAGGTSWVGVETLRAAGPSRDLGVALWDWGIPTAAAISYAARRGMTVIATGGIRTGSDVARAIALGASAAGMARRALTALTDGGPAAVDALIDGVEAELRAIMLLTGSSNVDDLSRTPRVITGELPQWLDADAGALPRR